MKFVNLVLLGFEIILLIHDELSRPKTTWMQTIRQDLSKIGIKLDLSNGTKTLNKLAELTQNRTDWSNIVKRVVQ